MSALLRSELLKLRTTRSSLAYPLALALLVGLAAAGHVGGAPDSERRRDGFLADVLGDASFVGLFALIIGIVAVTNEFRHGTITPTLLVSPVRERLVAVKALAATLYGLALGLLALAVALAVALSWLAALDVPLDLGRRDVWETSGAVLVAAALWAALGVAVGAVVHSQVAALVGSLIWLLVAETLLAALLPAVDLDGVADYFPGAVLDGLNPATSADDLPFATALAAALGYVLALGAAGAVRTSRRDIT